MRDPSHPGRDLSVASLPPLQLERDAYSNPHRPAHSPRTSHRHHLRALRALGSSLSSYTMHRWYSWGSTTTCGIREGPRHPRTTRGKRNDLVTGPDDLGFDHPPSSLGGGGTRDCLLLSGHCRGELPSQEIGQNGAHDFLALLLLLLSRFSRVRLCATP